jgi:hypothetical protein
MAVTLASAVKIIDSWTEGQPNGKYHRCFRVQLTLATQGGATNNVPASIFGGPNGGLTHVYESSSAVYSDNSKIVPTAPSYDYTMLLIGGGASNAPQDITATVYVTVKGW